MKTIVPSVTKMFIALGLLVLATIFILLIGNMVISIVVIPILLLAHFVYINTLSCPSCSKEINDSGLGPPWLFWLIYIPFSCPHCGEDLTETDFKE